MDTLLRIILITFCTIGLTGISFIIGRAYQSYVEHERRYE